MSNWTMVNGVPVVEGVPVALPPPKGYFVNFEDPARNSVTAAYVLFGVGNFLCLLFMLQRVYVRAVIQKMVLIEDACLSIAYIFSVVLQTLIIRDFARGIMGTHAWEMPLTKFGLFVRALYLLPILYNPVQCGAKMALLFVYGRLSPQMWYRVLVWITAFFVCGSSFAITWVTIFPCKPIRAAWDMSILDGECINRNAVYTATAGLGAATDTLVFALPIPIVLPLQISKKQKAALVGFFGIGLVTVFTSIMRLYALVYSMGKEDQSWGGGPVLLWIFAEANLSCICASLPTMKAFVRHIAPRLLGTTDPSSKSGPKSLGSQGLVTIGGSGYNARSKRDEYQRFDDVPLYTLQSVGERGETPEQPYETDVSASNWKHERQGSGSGSERGIMQTGTTTTVAYK